MNLYNRCKANSNKTMSSWGTKMKQSDEIKTHQLANLDTICHGAKQANRKVQDKFQQARVNTASLDNKVDYVKEEKTTSTIR